MDGWNLGEEVSSTSSLFGNMKGEGRKEGKEKGKKKGKTVVGDETMGARVEQRGGSTRQEDMREGGKVESVEGENRYDYQGNSQKNPPLGRKRRKSVEQTKRKKSMGRRKKGSGRTERGRRRRRV